MAKLPFVGALFFFVNGGKAKMDILDLQWIYNFYDGYIVFTMDMSPLTMDISFLQWIRPFVGGFR
ncbi:hypothetical protein B4U37_03995 [Sutcliffiella horikoshii]|uniref:Uncharacterized protein n=1 Tax=Sutcliffiella horikoshii TaxID=79883 RepID=A0ABM6KG41_9BACI|nr:hypothetical protein B4U37_03995 [Sutcliffiella horikoshii]